MFTVKQLLPLAVWGCACLLLVEAVRPRDDDDDEMEPEGNAVSELEIECTASVNGIWASLQRGGMPKHLSFPEECKPDGEVPVVAGLPNVKGSFNAVCYTDERAKKLGVDMQGCPLDSECARELAKSLADRPDVPKCEPTPVKHDTEPHETAIPAASETYHETPPETHHETPPEEHPVVPPPPAIATQGTEPVADPGETVASGDELTDVLKENKGEQDMADVPDPDAPKDMGAVSSPAKQLVREVTSRKKTVDTDDEGTGEEISAFDEDQDGNLDFRELVEWKHEVSVIKTMKTVQMTLENNETQDLKSVIKVQAFTFTFKSQEYLHTQLEAVDTDGNGELNPEELRHLEAEEDA